MKNNKEKFGAEIYLDIEGTIIDDLDNCNFIERNCEFIRNTIKMYSDINEAFSRIAKNNIRPYRVHFYTWGWKDCFDIQPFLAKKLFAKLEIPDGNHGSICTKGFSINGAIADGLLNREDYDRAIEPGMMAEFGINKVNCFISDIRNNRLDAGVYQTVLMDDLVEEKYINTIVDDKTLFLLDPNKMTRRF